MSYFPPYNYSKNKIELELDLSNFATKYDLKSTTGADVSECAKKYDLANLKSEVDKLDIDKLCELDVAKLKPVPTDLRKLNDVVKNDVVKKKDYNAKIKNIKDKISSITNLATNGSLDVKVNDVKGDILSVTNLATTASLTTVDNKIPNVSDLVKKADYDAEI